MANLRQQFEGQMGQEIEAAHLAFINIEGDLRRALKEPINESDTRFQVLDRVLVELMGWQRSSISTEPPTSDGYIDYLLKTGDGRNAMVIEAKRVGKLTPHSNAKGVSNLAINGPVLKPLMETIKQALRYSAEEGAAHAAVTDGNCWVFFRASRTDGRKPLEGKAIMFRDLDAVHGNFPLFYELLSEIGIKEKRNAIHLARAEGLKVAIAEDHFFVSDPSKARMLPAQDFASDAALLFSRFFTRLFAEGDEQMLLECFVETAESKKADAELKKITQMLLNRVRTLETKEGAALQQEVRRAIASQRSETILLIGNKGSGKSTFIRRFFRSVLDPVLRDQCAIMTVDLEGFHGARDDVQSWTIKELRAEVEKVVLSRSNPTYDDLQGVFWDEYVRWRDVSHKNLYEHDKPAFKIEFEKHVDGLRKNEPDVYVRHLLRRSIHANNQLPCVIFDNTDQFNSQVQDGVYQVAHALGTTTPILGIVPITDRTVWRLGKSGALQSYSARSFYLPVPEAKKIIARRVEFVKTKLEGDAATAHAYFSAKGFQIGLKDLGMIADAIEAVLVQQDYVSGLMGRLGNFDIRRMLKIAERIFLSPEIRIDEIVKSHFSGRPITAEGYRTYRALLKGQYDRFSDEENDYVTNLFLTDAQNPTSPLLPVYLLAVLRARAATEGSGAADERHWQVSEIMDYMEIAGVAQEISLRALQRMLNRGLIEGFDPNVEQLTTSDLVAIKEAGDAHLDLAFTSSTYLEQCALTTGVNDRTVRDKMKDLMRGKNQQSFFSLRNVFLDYLLKTDARKITVPGHPDFRILNDVRTRFRQAKAST